MRVCSLLVLSLLAWPALAEDKKIEWSKVASDKGRFEVQFPGKSTDQSKEGTTQFVLETLGGKAAHLVTSTAMPKRIDITSKDLVKQMFDNGRDGLTKAFEKSKILFERNTTHEGKYPAREVDLDIPGLGLYRTKWVVTPTAFIQMVVLGPPDYVEGGISSLFLESLKIPAEKN